MKIKTKMKEMKTKMAKKLKSENSEVKPITEEGIQEMKEEIEGEKNDD